MVGSNALEQFLRMSEDEVNDRVEEYKRRIPTIGGLGYIEERLKLYKVEPWPFIIYLAHNMPSLLNEGLDSYTGYNGAEAYQTIIQNLKEYNTLVAILIELHDKDKLRKSVIETQR